MRLSLPEYVGLVVATFTLQTVVQWVEWRGLICLHDWMGRRAALPYRRRPHG